MTAYTFVAGAERMLTAAALGQDGLRVRFADDREGVIPWQELGLTEPAVGVNLPRPHVIEVQLASGAVAEVPWDFARHFASAGYRATSEAAADRGRRVLAERVRALRSRRGLSQRALAERARVTRVSVARIEAGHQVPRFSTLAALAGALSVGLEELAGGGEE